MTKQEDFKQLLDKAQENVPALFVPDFLSNLYAVYKKNPNASITVNTERGIFFDVDLKLFLSNFANQLYGKSNNELLSVTYQKKELLPKTYLQYREPFVSYCTHFDAIPCNFYIDREKLPFNKNFDKFSNISENDLKLLLNHVRQSDEDLCLSNDFTFTQIPVFDGKAKLVFGPDLSLVSLPDSGNISYRGICFLDFLMMVHDDSRIVMNKIDWYRNNCRDVLKNQDGVTSIGEETFLIQKYIMEKITPKIIKKFPSFEQIPSNYIKQKLQYYKPSIHRRYLYNLAFQRTTFNNGERIEPFEADITSLLMHDLTGEISINGIYKSPRRNDYKILDILTNNCTIEDCILPFDKLYSSLLDSYIEYLHPYSLNIYNYCEDWEIELFRKYRAIWGTEKYIKVFTNDGKCERMLMSTFIRDFCVYGKYETHNLISITCGDIELLPSSYFDTKYQKIISEDDIVSIQLPPMTM